MHSRALVHTTVRTMSLLLASVLEPRASEELQKIGDVTWEPGLLDFQIRRCCLDQEDGGAGKEAGRVSSSRSYCPPPPLIMCEWQRKKHKPHTGQRVHAPLPRGGGPARHQSRSSQSSYWGSPNPWGTAEKLEPPCLKVVERRTPTLCPDTPQGA